LIQHERDAGQVTGLLRREPLICTSCAAVKLALTLERVVDAAAYLTRVVAVEQALSRCPICAVGWR